MSVIQKGDTVLVTGVTGYVAGHVADVLLAAGYKVRGTARSPEKASFLQQHFDKAHPGKFEVVSVKDITAPDAFDSAVKGVQGIAHVASWTDMTPGDPNIAINIAVNGTVNILESARRFAGPQLKAVVVTGSIVSHYNNYEEQSKGPAHTLTEADWNDWILDEAKRLGSDLDPFNAYIASKIAAERALWKWRDDNKPAFTISSVNPSWMYGPWFAPADKPAAPSTAGWLVPYLFGEGETQPVRPGNPFVDVRDVAELHVRALENKAADGERFLGAGPNPSPADLVRHIGEKFPELKPKLLKPVDHPDTTLKVDASKSEKVLGLKYRKWEESIVDQVRAYKEHGTI